MHGIKYLDSGIVDILVVYVRESERLLCLKKLLDEI